MQSPAEVLSRVPWICIPIGDALDIPAVAPPIIIDDEPQEGQMRFGPAMNVLEKPRLLSDAPSSLPPVKSPCGSDIDLGQIEEFNDYTFIFSFGYERKAISKQDLLLAHGEDLAEATSGNEDEDHVLKFLVDAHEECMHASIVVALDAGRGSGFGSFSVSVGEEFE